MIEVRKEVRAKRTQMQGTHGLDARLVGSSAWAGKGQAGQAELSALLVNLAGDLHWNATQMLHMLPTSVQALHIHTCGTIGVPGKGAFDKNRPFIICEPK
jgi:hypothetical protein